MNSKTYGTKNKINYKLFDHDAKENTFTVYIKTYKQIEKI